MRKNWILAAVLVLATAVAHADEKTLQLTGRYRNDKETLEKELKWEASQTALIICDMWDQHWCKSASRRCGELAPRLNDMANSLRAKGVLIVHAPSDTMKAYENTPQRKLAMSAPVAEKAKDIPRWRYIDKAKEGILPIDDTDGGCDDQPTCPNYRAWKGQHPAIKIEGADAISDNGQEIYNLFKQRGIKNVIVCGVHTNMCVLGRSFGIRQMVTNGFDVVLVRDLTDTMYNPRKAPFVPHARGTDLVIQHVEKNWCPSIHSSDILGDKKQPHIVIALNEQEYKSKETMPGFAKVHLEPLGFKVTILQSDDVKNLPGTEAIDSADLLVLFMRRTTLPEDQFNRFKKYLDEGRPVVAIRTGSHAFQNYLQIDKEVLGVTYGRHYNNADGTDVTPNMKMIDHPIIRDVSPLQFRSAASLYRLNPLMETATPLLFGKCKDNPIEPVAIINTYKGGRAFYLALGHPEDFKLMQVKRILTNGILWALDKPIPQGKVQAQKTDLPEAIRSAKGLDSAVETLHAPLRKTDALSPQEQQKKFKLQDGLAIDLIASEPDVRQPLHINFDERGRMWVVQYIQYPYPQGLKVVEYDRYIRAKFDKVPKPPPHGDRGHDKITIHEDSDGDGSFDKIKTFVDGLSIATSTLVGRGGVWVTNPPYLLFYPDKNRDDIPDSEPIVHLSGFGLEDTHAVASSLMWGPDGWIYGSQGSTCVANIKAPLSKEPDKVTRFLGQAIWRYHPDQHRFEIFAEGGGNTFGVEFDDEGNLFSGTNWGNFRGVHYVQGGYYVKGWGKHGPLTNPYAFGYFDHMPHQGNADRLTHTFIIYGGGLLPEKYNNKIIGPNPLMSWISVTRLEKHGSTFKTIEEDRMLTSDDGWFRPVDLKTGPDGALYIADFYEKRISHVDPRDNWNRETGRIWRIRPNDWKPGIKPFDMAKLDAEELVNQLSDKNRWVRATALRVLRDHHEKPSPWRLRRIRNDALDQIALESLWALYATEELRIEDWQDALKHLNPSVRRWGIRLLGDAGLMTDRLIELAQSEKDPQVRSQLASTLRRTRGEMSVMALSVMLERDDDAKDAHIPLLLWWAVEANLSKDRSRVLAMLQDKSPSQLALGAILPRVARRLASEPTPANQEALLALLENAPGDVQRKGLVDGIVEALKGKSLADFTPPLREALKKWGGQELALLAGDDKALATTLDFVSREEAAFKAQRIEMIAALSRLGRPEAVPVLLEVAEKSQSHAVRRATLSALANFDEAEIGQHIIGMYEKLPADQNVRNVALTTLTSRQAWAEALIMAVSKNQIAKTDIKPEHLLRLHQLEDPRISGLADATFGTATATSEAKQKEILRIAAIVASSSGDAAAGKALFNSRCGQCHRLFGEGGNTAPDLTNYERKNLDFLFLSTIDPSAYVREEYTNFRIKTTDGQTLFGLISERAPGHITLTDSALEKTTVPKSRIKDERALTTSIMPEDLLTGLSDAELRDLFAYLTAPKPPPAAAAGVSK